jgi:cation:H+ antiporter
MIISVFQILGGFFLLFVGGESLVRGAIQIAQRLKMSKLLIGITIVAYGTSSPELLITVQAVMNNFHEIALGNVIGSNIANIFLVLGISAVIYPISVSKKLVNFDIYYLIIASIALILFMMLGVINRYEAIILLLILIVYTISTFRTSKKNNDNLGKDQVDEVSKQLHVKKSLPFSITFLFIGIAALTYGAHILVSGASDIASQFGVSEAVIAVTIVALGGCAPEISTSIIAALHKHSDIAIGNVIGSNIFNILAILGVGALIHPITTNSSLATFDIWVMAFATILLYLICKAKLKISRNTGIGFLILYALYISKQIWF